jgi:hypothetical protein
MLEVVERVLVDICPQIAIANGFAAIRIQIAHAHVKLAIVRIDLRGVCHGLALGRMHRSGGKLQGYAEFVDLGQAIVCLDILCAIKKRKMADSITRPSVPIIVRHLPHFNLTAVKDTRIGD